MEASIANDTYQTIEQAVENILFKEKNSKFIGYAFPIQNEEDVKLHLEQVKKEHYAARHWCYAYQLGTENIRFRANDDGEPNNSAGMPIYGQIQSFAVTNLLVVVVRYFGGVKLGVGGLISAYKTCAQLTLAEALIVEKTINKHFLLQFDYKDINKVMRVIKEKQIDIIAQKMEIDCRIEIATRKKNAPAVVSAFQQLFEIKIKELES